MRWVGRVAVRNDSNRRRALAAWGALGAVALSLVVGFVLANTDETRVDLFVWAGRRPLAEIVLVAVVAGFVLDELARWLWRRASRQGRAPTRAGHLAPGDEPGDHAPKLLPELAGLVAFQIAVLAVVVGVLSAVVLALDYLARLLF